MKIVSERVIMNKKQSPQDFGFIRQAIVCVVGKCVLTVGIHIVVVALIVAGGNVVHPLFIVKIPSDGPLKAFFEL